MDRGNNQKERAKILYEMKTNFERKKNTNESKIRNSNSVLHRKYYDYILTKVKID